MSKQPRVVISGAGIIGASTAYYLSLRGVRPIVLDACTPASSASGKAGGFLALDWCEGSTVDSLARKSFALHAELAKDFDCGYRKMRAHSAMLEDEDLKKKSIGGRRGSTTTVPSCFNEMRLRRCQVIGSEDTVAQVHPKLLTEALLEYVVEHGGVVRSHTKAAKLEMNHDTGRVTGLLVQHESQELELIEADVVVFAMGAWTTESLKYILPEEYPHTLPAVEGLKVHSIVLEDAESRMTPDALFLSHGSKEPEVYPRPDKTVYICGVQSDEPLPTLASMVEPEGEAIEYLQGVACSISDGTPGALLQQQACYLPCSSTNKPIIGELPDISGAFIAAGHSCWGILMGPATGLGLAERILTRENSFSVNLDPFTPCI
ncbi:Putative oxidoreductase C1F5.03c [Picochlorum sp. SENEW3]|nr:Putative oxidoreductase C1F5.03c [Picochlorum sp. SENEW3]WPT14684.1 Putative oxidoreductase C1F5.03c [Picochlorum sp. SENEW3]